MGIASITIYQCGCDGYNELSLTNTSKSKTYNTAKRQTLMDYDDNIHNVL